jgi:hypothetical protein
MSLPETEIPGPESPLPEPELRPYDVMVKRIVSLRGGLIESKQHEKGQILQFIHLSAKDFLLRDSLRFLGVASRGNPIGQGYYQLSIICANYMRLAKVNNLNEPGAEAIKAQLPFMDYAARYWFLHAEKAESLGVPPDYLLRFSQHCPKLLERWARVYAILDRYNDSGRRPDGSSTMLHIASSSNVGQPTLGLGQNQH